MYGIKNAVEDGFSETVEKTEEELEKQGFGGLTETNIREKMDKKLDVDFQNYKISGARSPSHMYEALQQEAELGLLLPCNVTLYEEGTFYVSAVDPERLLEVAENDDIESIASEIKGKLQSAVEEVAE